MVDSPGITIRIGIIAMKVHALKAFTYLHIDGSQRTKRAQIGQIIPDFPLENIETLIKCGYVKEIVESGNEPVRGKLPAIERTVKAAPEPVKSGKPKPKKRKSK